MNDREVMKLTAMLWQATLEHKIEWKSIIPSNGTTYSIVIDGCRLVFAIYFDPMIDLWMAKTEFYNTAGKIFYEGLFDENNNNEIYKRIDMLINTINDQTLQITESKEKIFQKLESILK